MKEWIRNPGFREIRENQYSVSNVRIAGFGRILQELLGVFGVQQLRGHLRNRIKGLRRHHGSFQDGPDSNSDDRRSKIAQDLLGFLAASTTTTS
ncbi:hypothetical protein L5515_014207 [Caenorhabditis briggsae]|uniref:Uncharacterized protein n=1 Tax=Caenorhabditis briggsae TaxID=6238 RepID=A0AAE9ECJ8_CAEBR|nr:hypothetical protein L5515_014207 [Caenorhabditis briggsae]